MKERIAGIKRRIHEAAIRSARAPEEIELVAVSKTRPAEDILEAVEAGAGCFGENYIQEARKKAEALSGRGILWHFIGHLQTNKAKYAVRIFDLIHTVDSIKLAKEIDRQAEKAGKIQKVLLQVNIGMELSKSGVIARDLVNLAGEVGRMENLRVLGLMTIPPFAKDPEMTRTHFTALRRLKDNLQQGRAVRNSPMNELSMGMTGDFEVAVEEGATMVRIGEAIFGKRI